MTEDPQSPQPNEWLLLFRGWVIFIASAILGIFLGAPTGLSLASYTSAASLFEPPVWGLGYLFVICPLMVIVQALVRRTALSPQAKMLWTLSPALLPLPATLIALAHMP
ncbi:hypothetical protein HQ560_11390 [bacterium]|nr:hypothetical protein [bacterium]